MGFRDDPFFQPVTPSTPGGGQTGGGNSTGLTLDQLSQTFLTRNGSNTPTKDLDLGGFRISGLGTGVSEKDAVTKAQLDAVSLSAPNDALVIATGSTANRALKDRFGDVVNIMDFGAVPGDNDTNAATNDAAFSAAIARLNVLKGGSLLVPDYGEANPFIVSQKIVINVGYINPLFYGIVKAAVSFAPDTDYLLNFILTASSTSSKNGGRFKKPMRTIPAPMLDCNYRCRGMYGRNLDHIVMFAPRVERALGNAYWFERIRESAIYSPFAIECAERVNFPDPAAWEGGSHIVGDMVRFTPPTWDIGTQYAPESVVLYGGKNYICLAGGAANVGHDPEGYPLEWSQFPYQDYICRIANTNKTPATFNSNSSNSANRCWQKTFQRDAVFLIDDRQDPTADCSNSVSIYHPVFRDNGTQVLVRLDSNKSHNPGRSIKFFSGHIEVLANYGNMASALVGSYNKPNQIHFEIGYVLNFELHAPKLQMGASEQAIGIMLGDTGTTKAVTGTRINGGSLSVDGNNQTGILVMPSRVSGGNDSLLTGTDISLGGTNGIRLFDYTGYFRNRFETTQYTRVNNARNTVPSSYASQFGSMISDARGAAMRFITDTSDRICTQITNSRSAILFGSGSASADVVIGRTAAGVLEVIMGQLKLPGTWDKPLIANGSYLWVTSAGVWRTKSGSLPSSEADGIAVGAQT